MIRALHREDRHLADEVEENAALTETCMSIPGLLYQYLLALLKAIREQHRPDVFAHLRRSPLLELSQAAMLQPPFPRE